MVARVATQSDILGLEKLVNSVYRGENAFKGWTTEAGILDGQRIDPEMLKSIIESFSERIFVIEEGSVLLGCVQSTDSADSVLLGMLSVPVELQGKGLGAHLIKVVEEDARNRGFKFIKMHVLDIREELLSYYERKGYQRTGESAEWPWGDLKWGIPKRDDLRFVVLSKPV
jgi:predicted N-acetyltransferase YhbS